jgi:hydroxymethylglutaryl-CoA lyase
MDVTLVEVSPRDGLQNEPTPVSTRDKVELVGRAVAAGLRRVEAVSFVNPDRVPQMADAEAVMAGVPRSPGVSYSGLVLNARGFDRAVAAGVDEVNVVVVTTDTFCLRNQNRRTADMVEVAADVLAAARECGIAGTVTVAAAFGCPFEGEVPAARVRWVVERLVERVTEHTGGVPDEIALADTIGVGVPRQVAELAAAVRDTAPASRLRFHFHNTRNTGYANALAAVEHSADALDASIGGIGGCPFAPNATGNIATEDLVYALHRSGVRTGASLDALTEAAAWLQGPLGAPVPALLGRAGPFPPAGPAHR